MMPGCSAIPGHAPSVTLIKVARGAMKNNNYLIVDPLTRQAVLVDPAWEAGKLQAQLTANEASLRGILITHAHFDHIDLAKPLADAHHCPIWMSRQEIDASGFRARQLDVVGERPWQLGSLTITPMLTPGHTPGCTCYQIGDNLFSGDVLFAEGCGICGDVHAAHAMFDSLQLLKQRLQPHSRIFPGHTYVHPPGQRFADVLANNPYLHFRDRHAFAAFRLRKGQMQRSLMNFR
jgi:hydroxyacylglutathione hydrolase